MMLIARSVFWLTAAYLVIRPDAQMPDAQAISAQAMAVGSQVIAEQISVIDCPMLYCESGKAIAAAAFTQSPRAGNPMHDLPATVLAPLPRPRPDLAG